MKQNIGRIDKLGRLGVGITIIYLHLSGIISGVLGTTLVTVAIILLLTGLVNVCPIYLALGWTTRTGKPPVNRKH